MRLSNYFLKTYKDDPGDAEVTSHKLMLRAGYIKKECVGVYTYLPIGLRVLKKVQSLIAEEMANINCQEVLMPSLSPIENYSTRAEKFGKDMFRLKDRSGKDYCLAPTHEELFTMMVRDSVQSYKDLPCLLYQFQTKFRDEARPRYGLMRVREFIMKDAYSFDKDKEGLDKAYNNIYKAYNNIFTRLGLDYIVVNADNGLMGGAVSQEFMVKSEIGDDTLIICDKCNVAYNEEKASVTLKNDKESNEMPIEKIYTPNTKTIEQLVVFLNKKASDFAKTLIYKCDDDLVAVVIRGDRDVQETKLKNIVGCNAVELASAEDVKKASGVEIGFVGPTNIGKNVKLVIDNSMIGKTNFITGAGEVDYHFINTNYCDITHEYIFADVNKVQHGDICPICGAEFKLIKGIEVGHVFKQGTYYSEMLGCNFLDEQGKSRPVLMGSYGIGLGRTIAAIIEQSNDDRGIILPKIISPFTAVIVSANSKDEIQNSVAENLEKLIGLSDVLYDDRAVSFGYKLKDAELIGVPYIIIVGRRAGDGIVELLDRRSGDKLEVTIDDAVKAIR